MFCVSNPMPVNITVLHNQKLENMNINNYPNILTPPLDSPDSVMLSPRSESNSPLLPSSHHYDYINNAMGPGEPYLQIIEEPVEKFRFRYKSEMVGTHGSLSGKTSDRSRKQTYPTVELHNFDKPALIRCSLYQTSKHDVLSKRYPHAHRLIKKYGSEEVDDPHDLQVNSDCGYKAQFHSMGIIHTAKKFIIPELTKKREFLKKEEIARIEHGYRDLSKKEEIEIKSWAEKESKNINLNIVCLKFEAFQLINGINFPICAPVYSNVINNLKSALTGDLKIVRMDHCSSPARGGKEIFILVEKVTKKNIKVRFFELDDDDNEIWSDYGHFNDLDVHHQYAIVFKTPPYKTLDIDQQVRVFIELQRPSDGARSEPKDFRYTPCSVMLGRKRTRESISSYNSSDFSSNELPLTLNNITGEQNCTIIDDQMETNICSVVHSDDLDAALKQNIDSAEFQKFFNSLIGVEPDNIRQLYAGEELSDKDLKSLLLDSPCTLNSIEKTCHPSSQIHIESINTTTSKQLSSKEQELITRVKTELTSFSKSKPPKSRILMMLKSVFDTHVSENGDTVLHLLMSENQNDEFLNFMLKILLNYKLSELVNIRNTRGQTALHLAVANCNFKAVNHLVLTKADTSIQDIHGNTVIHIAVLKNVPIIILQMLLQSDKDTNRYIDLLNYDGLTALHLAVKMNNLNATKLLCWNNADVNAEEKKTGYTVLHMAVDEQCIDIIKFLLEKTNIKCQKQDYRNYSCLKLAKMLINENNLVTLQIYKIIETFMKNNGIPLDIDIKEECEELSDEEMEEVKMEPASPNMTPTNTPTFTEDYLNKVCTILDKSETWQNLAELLDYGHLLKTDLFTSVERPSKILLEFAMQNGDSLIQIRNFLENLDEVKAVELIDEMMAKQTYF